VSSEAALIAHRPYLLTYCQRLVGDLARAEDLAQETLLIGLAHLREERPITDWPTWLGGIARRLAKNTLRRSHSARETAWDESLALDDPALEALLLAERGQLLDRAFALLDTPTRTLLTQRYLDELPVTALAETLQLTENAVSLRLLRAREALERVLVGHLKADALAHGLIDTATADGWVESPLFCPRCADHRLQGRLTGGELALRCPECDRSRPGLQGLSTRATPMPQERVLAGARGFRVAQRRVNDWWQGYITSGLTQRMVRCPECSRPAHVTTRIPNHGTPGFCVLCDACQFSFFVAPQGLLFHDSTFQQFWKDHPRVRSLPPKSLTYQGCDAIWVGFADRQSGARVEAIYAKDDLRVLMAGGEGKNIFKKRERSVEGLASRG